MLHAYTYGRADKVRVLKGGTQRRLPDDRRTNTNSSAYCDVDERVLEYSTEDEDETDDHPHVNRLDVRHLQCQCVTHDTTELSLSIHLSTDH